MRILKARSSGSAAPAFLVASMIMVRQFCLQRRATAWNWASFRRESKKPGEAAGKSSHNSNNANPSVRIRRDRRRKFRTFSTYHRLERLVWKSAAHKPHDRLALTNGPTLMASRSDKQYSLMGDDFRRRPSVRRDAEHSDRDARAPRKCPGSHAPCTDSRTPLRCGPL
jgi:hypothetical protein